MPRPAAPRRRRRRTVADAFVLLFKDLAAVDKRFAQIDRVMDRATMYAIRSAGRRINSGSRSPA